MPTFRAPVLEQFTHDLFAAAGVGTADARLVARSLVGANLRGHDSHGVMRIPFYIQAILEGRVRPAGTLTIERETPAVLVCDGGWGLGQVLSHDLLGRLIAKASLLGLACGTLRQAAHIGRLGEYAERAAEQGMAAFICANTNNGAQRVAPVGGKRPRLGTNPLCLGMPGGREGPFVLDFGTSATAEGKVRVKKIAGQPVPLGWILDSSGRPTTDPNQLYADPPGTILPLGGDQAYKGFGLAYMIEMLSGGLSGGPCAGPQPLPPLGNCAVFVLIDPQLFAGREHQGHVVRELEEYVRQVPLVDGVSAIALPGDPERRALRDRESSGVPLDDGNWQALAALAAKLGVEVCSSQGERGA